MNNNLKLIIDKNILQLELYKQKRQHRLMIRRQRHQQRATQMINAIDRSSSTMMNNDEKQSATSIVAVCVQPMFIRRLSFNEYKVYI
jgi:hypothetical protein